MKSILYLFILAFSLFSTPVFGQSVRSETQTPKFQYRESDVGIDYRALAGSSLAEMLSFGEVEFFENASSVFGDELAEVWEEMATEIGTGRISNFTVKDMKEFTPNMLRSFSDIDLSHPKYGRLSSLASLFISEGFLATIKDK